eukprot:1160808-Pelagomonas_calceolata.AAC.40
MDLASAQTGSWMTWSSPTQPLAQAPGFPTTTGLTRPMGGPTIWRQRAWRETRWVKGWFGDRRRVSAGIPATEGLCVWRTSESAISKA